MCWTVILWQESYKRISILQQEVHELEKRKQKFMELQEKRRAKLEQKRIEQEQKSAKKREEQRYIELQIVGFNFD